MFSQAFMMLSYPFLWEGYAFNMPCTSWNMRKHGAGQPRFMVSSEITSPLDLEREVVVLGKSGQTDEALEIYNSVPRPSIRLLNGAIDACSRARPPRLQQAFDLLTDAVREKNLRPNVFTFGSLVSACSRARKADLAIKVLRSMEVSTCKWCLSQHYPPTNSTIAERLRRQTKRGSLLYSNISVRARSISRPLPVQNRPLFVG
jgi:pentatricopeptide repeat protein